MLNFMGLVLAPGKAEKKDSIKFGRSICNPWGTNVPSFIDILTSMF
jgi:hypothetical protein